MSRYSLRMTLLVSLLLLMAGPGMAMHLGPPSDTNDDGTGDPTWRAGCTCHASEPDNSVTIVLDGVPYHYSGSTAYEMKIQLIGGPDILSGGQTGGFSIRVSSGTLSAAEGYESLVQNWEGDDKWDIQINFTNLI